VVEAAHPVGFGFSPYQLHPVSAAQSLEAVFALQSELI
jgi:hypothetical protein